MGGSASHNGNGKQMTTHQIYQETIGQFLTPIRPLLEDPSVSEVLVNGPQTVYYEQGGKIRRAEGVKFTDANALLAAARNIAEFVGREIGPDHHSADARLPDGSRVHIIIPPSSRVGVCLSIRRFAKSTFSLPKLVDRGSMSPEAAEFLALCVKLHKNMIISGGTGTGKTSMLNALSAEIPSHERVIVIEDTNELQLAQEHTVYLEAQPARPDGKGQVTIRDLFVDSLRMRPDRIVVGEVRRGEALDLIQSMISGHSGALATVHANTPRDAAVRLETLCLMADVGLPVHVARVQVASGIHLVLQIARYHDGSRRVQQISECHGLDDKNDYKFVDLYKFHPTGVDKNGKITGEMRWTGMHPTFATEPYEMGYADLVKLTRNVFVKPQEGSLPHAARH